MDIGRELDLIIHTLETGKYNWFIRRLLRWRKAMLERLIP